MNPGRKLDALVGEHVMGLQKYQNDNEGYSRDTFVYAHNDIHPETGKPIFVVDCPAYSTEIEAAWEVVEELNANGWNVCIASRTDGKHACFITKEFADNGSAPYHESVPHAICLAALHALGFSEFEPERPAAHRVPNGPETEAPAEAQAAGQVTNRPVNLKTLE